MDSRIVLFEGQIGTERAYVWLERSAEGGIALRSREIGPQVETAFGTDEISTFLAIDADALPALTAALDNTSADPMALLADQYRKDPMATTHLRTLLAAHEIPHRFSVVRE